LRPAARRGIGSAFTNKKNPGMPDRPPSKMSFRSRYDALEQRRADLLTRLEALGERARANPAYGRARTLLNTTFRRSKLVQRAAILEAADWLIALVDRTLMML
jgi:hypothetical protein